MLQTWKMEMGHEKEQIQMKDCSHKQKNTWCQTYLLWISLQPFTLKKELQSD